MRKNFKKSAIVLFAVLAFLAVNVTVFAAGRWVQAYQDDTLKIKFDGVVQNFTDPDDGSKIVPILYNERTYLPVRAIANLAGLGVDYDEATNSVLLTSDGSEPKPYKDSDSYPGNTTGTTTGGSTGTTNNINPNNVAVINSYNKINIGDTLEQVLNKLGTQDKAWSDTEYYKSYEWNFEDGTHLDVDMTKEYGEEIFKVESKEVRYSIVNNEDYFKDSRVDLSGAKEISSQVESGGVTYDKLVQLFKTPGIQVSLDSDSERYATEYVWVDSQGQSVRADIGKDNIVTWFSGYVY